MEINQKTCTRCNGTGKHSFNLKDGDVCYGCGGTGKTLVTPKGQKKVKATAELRNCKVGDIVEIGKVMCVITSIKWIQHNPSNWMDDRYNQVVRYTRLVNDQKMKTWRSVYDSTGTFIEVTDEMKGTEV